MTQPLSKDRFSLFAQANGPGTQLGPIHALNDYTIGEMSMSAAKNTRIAGSNPDGSFALLYNQKEPPEPLADISIETYRTADITFLEQALRDNKPIILQQRHLPCGLLTNPFNEWSDLIHVFGDVTAMSFPETRNRQPSGENTVVSYTVSPHYNVHLVMPETLSLPTGNTDNLLCVDTINAKGRAIGVVPFAGTSAGEVIFSTDYGQTFNTMTNLPFNPTNDAISEIVADENCNTNFRLIVGSGANPSIAYGDADYGDELGLVWISSTGLGSASGTVGALLINKYGMVYAAIGTDLYRSDDRGSSFALVYNGAETITFLNESPQGLVWGGGENGLLIRQFEANGSFYEATSPAVTHNTVVDIANDSTVLVGNGTRLYRSDNEAANAGGWSTVALDFGSAVVFAKFIGSRDSGGGDSELILVATANGKAFFSESGGAHFRQVSTNSATYVAGTMVNQHLHLVVGNTGVMHRIGMG